MKRAYIFPGQGSQFVGMGQDLYQRDPHARSLFELANQIIGFSITDSMFAGTEEALQQTHIAQPAIFIHSTILAIATPDFQPDMVAGHSLGEFSALVASGVLSFEEGLQLVIARAKAMQQACEQNPGTMAAILGLSDEEVASICANIQELVVSANYNCPGQVVISGNRQGVALACEALQAAGAKKIVPLKVGGGFHSPLMQPAQTQLATAISQVTFKQGICPIYQNVTGLPTTDPVKIKQQLLQQLTSPIYWTQTIQHMVQDGAKHFIECGPGKVLQGLVRKIDGQISVESMA
jgi:[acyl-carrier-protein] S-malonyltransferase